MSSRNAGVQARGYAGKSGNEGGGSGKENRQVLKRRFEKLLKHTKGVNLKDNDVTKLLIGNGAKCDTKRTDPPPAKKTANRKLLVALSSTVVIPVLLGVLSMIFGIDIASSFRGVVRETPCLVDNNAIVMEVARPLVDCKMCANLHAVPVERNITKKDFIEKYAYSGVPVLIKGATSKWTAMDEFTFKFFKDLYQSRPEVLQNVDEDCQFFPYKTEFTSLTDVFDMTEDRANFKPGQPNWYIGWSNCHPDTGEELRKHYTKPYFLPEDSESSSIDWLFMGGSGDGANIHLDYVQRPSWQAQISGKKSWALVPTPECESVCPSMNVTVEKGDIIVVDTNTWYHATFVHPGEISITIGSEYD